MYKELNYFVLCLQDLLPLDTIQFIHIKVDELFSRYSVSVVDSREKEYKLHNLDWCNSILNKVMRNFRFIQNLYLKVSSSGNLESYKCGFNQYILNFKTLEGGIMNEETKSVISFLEENSSIITDYIETRKTEVSPPKFSYSALLLSVKLKGTTKDEVDFQSSRVSRSVVTDYLLQKYGEMLND